MIRVELPPHLRTLAGVTDEVALEVTGAATQRSVLDALEARYPVLRGTIRDHVTQQRRPFVRFFACARDWSHEPPDTPLPAAVASGAEPLLVIGAVAGGEGRSLQPRSFFTWPRAASVTPAEAAQCRFREVSLDARVGARIGRLRTRTQERHLCRSRPRRLACFCGSSTAPSPPCSCSPDGSSSPCRSPRWPT